MSQQPVQQPNSIDSTSTKMSKRKAQYDKTTTVTDKDLVQDTYGGVFSDPEALQQITADTLIINANTKKNKTSVVSEQDTNFQESSPNEKEKHVIIEGTDNSIHAKKSPNNKPIGESLNQSVHNPNMDSENIEGINLNKEPLQNVPITDRQINDQQNSQKSTHDHQLSPINLDTFHIGQDTHYIIVSAHNIRGNTLEEKVSVLRQHFAHEVGYVECVIEKFRNVDILKIGFESEVFRNAYANVTNNRLKVTFQVDTITEKYKIINNFYKEIDERTIRLMDVPLDMPEEEIKIFLEKKFNTRINNIWTPAPPRPNNQRRTNPGNDRRRKPPTTKVVMVEFKDTTITKKFFEEDIWTIERGQYNFRILPTNWRSEESIRRTSTSYRIQGLGPNVTARDLKGFVKHIKGKTCYVPTNPHTGKSMRYAIVFTDKDNEITSVHRYKVDENNLFVTPWGINICTICGSTNHGFMNCDKKPTREQLSDQRNNQFNKNRNHTSTSEKDNDKIHFEYMHLLNVNNPALHIPLRAPTRPNRRAINEYMDYDPSEQRNLDNSRIKALENQIRDMNTACTQISDQLLRSNKRVDNLENMVKLQQTELTKLSNINLELIEEIKILNKKSNIMEEQLHHVITQIEGPQRHNYILTDEEITQHTTLIPIVPQKKTKRNRSKSKSPTRLDSTPASYPATRTHKQISNNTTQLQQSSSPSRSTQYKKCDTTLVSDFGEQTESEKDNYGDNETDNDYNTPTEYHNANAYNNPTQKQPTKYNLRSGFGLFSQ
ncbi:hypothetical protein RhiirA1_461532 [Rhizophagus irregularis]|uniref:Uncharacterized protein n=1 Tax=Rhizophagus irregularis TaxID=588596 RepID=A0A2I1EJQ9_9GLOM|nr:hypothetical protein RhiirA1_461532 [Rhizophagus irregularis]PKY22345.1 hypothetical protein RhiirB3_436258 [Rhizophagus irregularis]CAB4485564.1 unnamed protein product [Rhizophagus irregularis]CAB5356711.1 unnamed protein product [Rhizophagus irregularis]